MYIESAGVSFSIGSELTAISGMYRSPLANVNVFIYNLTTILSYIIKKFYYLMRVEDFNIYNNMMLIKKTLSFMV